MWESSMTKFDQVCVSPVKTNDDRFTGAYVWILVDSEGEDVWYNDATFDTPQDAFEAGLEYIRKNHPDAGF